METEEDLFGKPKYNTKGAFVWNNVSKRFLGAILFYSILFYYFGFPFQLFCSQGRNSQNIFPNIFLFQIIPNVKESSKFYSDRTSTWGYCKS